jgi:hypothetical protein
MPSVNFTLGGTLRFVAEEGDVFFTIRCRDFVVTARGKDMAYTLASGMQVHVKVSYIDAAGNPAVVDGEVAWSSSNPSIATVAPEGADSAVVRAAGPTGQVQITATADADLGDGTREIVTPMDVSVAAGEAVAGTIEPVGGAEPVDHIEHRQ